MCGIHQKLPLLLPSAAWHLKDVGGWQDQERKSETDIISKALLLSHFHYLVFCMQPCKSCSPPWDPHILLHWYPLCMNTQHLCGHPQPLLFHFWLTQKTKRKSEATKVRRAQCAHPTATSPGLCQGRDAHSADCHAGHMAACRVAEVGFGDFRATGKKTGKETHYKKSCLYQGS